MNVEGACNPDRRTKLAAELRLMALVLAGSCAAHAAAPTNDECANAIPVALDTIVYGTTVEATGSAITTCANADINDVWYTFTVPSSGICTISLCDDTAMDTTLAVFDACAGTEIACNDDYCDFASRLELEFVPGTYYVRVAGFDGVEGTFSLSVSSPQPPGHDACADAIPLPLDTIVYGTTTGATGTDLTSCGDNDTGDVWYAFTALYAGLYAVSLCDDTLIDTTLAVYDACDGAELACNNDSCGGASYVELPVAAGTYYVRVAGNNGIEGPFSLTVISPPPPNDECADATPVALDTVVYGTTSGATGTDLTTCAFNDFNDVWYAFTALFAGTHTISLCGDTGLDTTLAVFDGCGGIELACNDDYCGGASHLEIVVDPGTYYLRIAGYSGIEGTFNLLVTEGVGGGVLSGVVRSLGVDDASPVTLGGAYVEVIEGATVVASSTTSSNGQYAIGLTPPGPYTVRVSASWHEPATVAGVSVIAGLTTTQDFGLRMTGADDCGAPPFLGEDSARSGSTVGAAGTDLSSCALNDGADVWFRYVPSASGVATFNLCDSALNTTLSIFDGCGGTELACNDDEASCGTGVQSMLSMAVLQASTYFVRVAGTAGATGEYTLLVTLAANEGEGEPPAGLQVSAIGETHVTRPLGDPVTFAVTVAGAQGVLSYQWVRITAGQGFEIIPDANGASFTLTEIAAEDAGEYQCEVSDDVLAETATSPVFTLVVTPEMPVAGLFGLTVAAALTGLAGAVLARKRR